VCCGALHAHYGDIEEARRLARINIDVFGKLGVDAVIADSAGCAAFLKEYGTVLRDDDRYAARAKLVASSAREITEFLADAGFASPARVEESSPREGVRVTYHDACHLVHTQNISRQPREITRAVPGIEFVELPEATWCCGSAGIYNVLRFSDSMKLLDRKMANIAGLHADIVLTANPGCHLQLVYGLRKCGLKAEVLHPVSLLNRWYRSQGNPGHSSAHLTPVNGSSG
jgi:glycolate oxidase iron-sulfur subunit